MRDRLEDFGDAAVALITFTRQRNLRAYRRRLRLPYPVLADETRECYRAYGLGRGRWWRIWGFSTIKAYARLLRGRRRRAARAREKGRRTRPVKEDLRQLGGDFVVDREGRLTYEYRPKGPADRPPVGDLVAAARRS